MKVRGGDAASVVARFLRVSAGLRREIERQGEKKNLHLMTIKRVVWTEMCINRRACSGRGCLRFRCRRSWLSTRFLYLLLS